MGNEEQRIVRSYVEGCEELVQALNNGWKVKFITQIGNWNVLEYVLYRIKED
ncbi:hypothetical protein [Vagococcus fluvialis]|uniref:hypothetical protein n=1 Tax=Vagococcus fluvialis TaxID=2738 RepID=UPI0022E0A13C|nr:hypothetical protein [Vagococcus fluvialis]